MASSKKHLRPTSEISDCFHNGPSKSNFTGVDDSALDVYVLSNRVPAYLPNSSFSKSEPKDFAYHESYVNKKKS